MIPGQFRPRIQFAERPRKKDIRFSSVDYSGVLDVVDIELIRKALFEGIGHAKAFGYGLMLIRPV